MDIFISERTVRLLRLWLLIVLLASGGTGLISPSRAADVFQQTGSMGAARRGHTATRLPDSRVLVAGGFNENGTVGGAELYVPSSGTWSGTANMGTARSGATAVLLQNGKVLVTGGRDSAGNTLASAELYDPANGAWTFTGAMTTPRRHHTANLLANGKVLVTGGDLTENATAALDTSELYDPGAGTWTESGLLNYARSFHTATLAGGQVFAVGGTSGNSFITVIELYMPALGTWNIMGTGPGTSDRARRFHTATLLPNSDVLVAGGTRDVPLATARLLIGYGFETTKSLSEGRTEHTAAVLSGNRVLAAGGLNAAGTPTASAETYNTSTKTWSAGAPLHTARAGHTATVLAGGTILITGGYNPTGTLSSCEIYLPQPTQWTETSPMTAGRAYHTATVLPGGDVLVTGGFGQHTVVGSAERYRPAEDAWSPASPFSPRVGHTAVLLGDGRVVVSGGYTDIFTSSHTSVTSLYHSSNRTWTTAGPVQSRRAFHAAVLLPSGKVLMAGGQSPPDNYGLDSVEVFDPASGLWSVAASMLTARQTPSATLLANGKVFVMSESPPTEPGSAELYDPVADTWQYAATPLYPHATPSLTLLPDGRVFVAGGSDYFNSSSTGKAEIYNPLTNTWTAAAPMRTEGVFHTSTLLQDGRVLVAGNYFYPMTGSGGRAEIYDPASNTWLGLDNVKSRHHAASLLLDGRILLSGGEIAGNDPATVRSQTFNAYFAETSTERPAVASASFDDTRRLVLSGTGFTGDPAVEPVVKLRRLDNGQTATLPADPAVAWSSTAFTSVPVTGFPAGPAMVTVYRNGIPGRSMVVNVSGPEISIAEAGSESALAAGSTVDFGSPPAGASSEISFIIRNTGSIDLSGLAVTISGAGAEFFSLTTAPANSVPGPSGTTTFSVRFSADMPGVRSALLHLASNDDDEGSFSLVLTGTGPNTAPVISSINPQVISEDTSTVLSFTVGDSETQETLTLSALSSNHSLIPPGRIVLAPGAETGRTVTLTPMPDASGQALITLMVSDGLLSASTTFTLTVTPVDDPPTLAAIPDPAPIPVNSGVRTLTLSGISAGPGETASLTITPLSSNPTLIPHPAQSYVNGAVAGTLRYTPAAGQSGLAVITVTVSDGNNSTSQTFTVRVQPVLQGEGTSVMEGNAGQSSLDFRLSVNSTLTSDVSVKYRVEAGSAEAGTDFIAASGTAVIAAGESAAFVKVQVAGDTLYEQDETLWLILTDPDGAVLGPQIRLPGTIINDDSQPSLSLTPGSVTESSALGAYHIWVNASLPSASVLPLTWTLSTRAGTAEADLDFTPLGPVALTFAAGEISKWVKVAIAGSQGQGEAEETFYLDATATSGPADPVTSVCTIRQLAVQDFFPLNNNLYALRFPTGIGQSYVIQESPTLAGPWTNSSTILLGSGTVVTQVVFSQSSHAWFRVSAAPAAPGPAAVGP